MSLLQSYDETVSDLQKLFAAAEKENKADGNSTAAKTELVTRLSELTDVQYCDQSVNFNGAKKILTAYLDGLAKKHRLSS